LYARRNRFAFTDEDVVGMTDVYITKVEDQEYDEGFIAAILNSALLNSYHSTFSKMKRAGYLEYSGKAIGRLPIQEIDFTTPTNEREKYAEKFIDMCEKALGDNARTDESAILTFVVDQLSASPDRSDVIHDLLSELANRLTDLLAERNTYHLNITDYISAPIKHGIGLRQICNRYQPAEGVNDSLLAKTKDELDGLRIGSIQAVEEGGKVVVRASVRYKPGGDSDTYPDSVPLDAELDQWGYIESNPIEVCSLHGCSELEKGLVVYWIKALNECGDGFSGYRDNATKNNSLLDRIYDAEFPDPANVADALKPFIDNAEAAEEIDRKIAFTDDLIDQVVYRLYGLSEKEIGLVEVNK